MVLVSCEAGVLPLGCLTATNSVGRLAFQCTPGLDRRHQRPHHPKVQNVIARMRVRVRPITTSGVSPSGGNKEDPSTNGKSGALACTWHTGEGLEWGAGGQEGDRADCSDGKAELVHASPECSSTAEGGGATQDHVDHNDQAESSPRRVAAAVSEEDDIGLLESVDTGGGVFHEGRVKRRHHQQRQQQRQLERREDISPGGARAGRGAAEGLWRSGGQQDRSTRSAGDVECDGGAAARSGARWDWPPRLFRPVHQQQQAGQPQRRPYGLLSQGPGYSSVGWRRSSGGGRRRGTAMSMSSSSSTGGGISKGDGDAAPSLRPADGGGGTGNGGLDGRDALAEGGRSFGIEPEEDQGRPWPLDAVSPAAVAAKGRTSKAQRAPRTPETARRRGGSTGGSEEMLSSHPKPYGFPQAEANTTPEQGTKSRTSSTSGRSGGSGSGVFMVEASAAMEAEGGEEGEFAEADAGPIAESYERGRWLLGLLVLQSTSSSVLDKYQDLLREHVVVTLFLTMLVGAGGNAGNQSAIKVIRGLATGRFTPDAACAFRIVGGQAIVGLVLGTALAAGGFIRVVVTDGTTLRDASAISISLFLIVMVSVLLGSALPFGFARAGVDPAHAGTTIQVAMDIVGVAVTCVTCSFVLTQLDQALSVPL